MKKKHLETKFLRFLIERYKDSEDDESEIDTPLSDEIDEPINLIDIPIKEDEEDQENQNEDDDIIIDKLLTEYRKIKKQYESKIHNKRK